MTVSSGVEQIQSGGTLLVRNGRLTVPYIRLAHDGSRGYLIVEVPQVHALVIALHLRLPLAVASQPRHAPVSRPWVAVAPPIGVILARRAEPQVLAAVVEPVQVDVVDLLVAAPVMLFVHIEKRLAADIISAAKSSTSILSVSMC